MSMTASQYRDFSNRMVGDVMSMIFASVFGGFPLSMNQYFPNHQPMMLQSYLNKKDPYKASHRHINFDVTEYEKLIDMAFKFHIATNYQKATMV